MDVLVFALVLVGLAAFVAAPLYGRTRPAGSPTPDHSARRHVVDQAIRDLEVDHASGLLDDAGYAEELAALEREAPAD